MCASAARSHTLYGVAVRVVLVDDDAPTRQLVATALRLRGGFEVVGEAENGADGVAVTGAEEPDVVVLDLGLPDIAGKEVLARLREVSPATSVIVFSGTETADRAWIQRHAEGFLLKDDDLRYLLETLESLGERSGLETSTELISAFTSVATARRFIVSALARWNAGDLAEDAKLLVSELVTNAILHGRGPCSLRICMQENTLRIEVLDGGAGSPEPQLEAWTSEHGRGLQLVNAIATAWGMESLVEDGKRVWADLTRVPA